MRAAWYDKKGPANEVLTVGEIDAPHPVAGEVLVAVRASGVNPSDTKARTGARGNSKISFERIIPHQDGAGVIQAVGDGVSDARIGERVWIYEAQLGRPFGTAAEFVAVPAHQAVPLPEQISFEEGASLGVPALTAHRCVFADGPVEGQTILVTGGAGAVGFYAIQFAKRGGAKVIATVSSEAQTQIAGTAGADLVINRHEEDVAAAISRFGDGARRSLDRIVEVAFGANLGMSLRSLKAGGVIAAYASDAQPEPTLPFWPLVMLDSTIRFVLVYVMSGEAHDAAIAMTSQGLREGWLKHNISLRFPLEQIADAHEKVERGGTGGKVVLHLA
jgi:NADPH:quinone reductase